MTRRTTTTLLTMRMARELEPLDLTEDQISEVFAVLEQKRRRPKTWNKTFKAETKKDRTSFVKGEDGQAFLVVLRPTASHVVETS